MLNALFAGFGLGASLVIAIGAQNALMLRMGLRRHYVATGFAICVSADWLLIAAGVAGLGSVLVAHPLVRDVVRWAGVAYLGIFAARALLAAYRGGQSLVTSDGAPSRREATLAIAGATWLNPHVYVDTVLVLGTVSSTYGQHRWWFGIGAMLCSTLWFALVGFGARLLTPLFAKAWTWRVLDLLVGTTVAVVAWSLAWRG